MPVLSMTMAAVGVQLENVPPESLRQMRLPLLAPPSANQNVLASWNATRLMLVDAMLENSDGVTELSEAPPSDTWPPAV